MTIATGASQRFCKTPDAVLIQFFIDTTTIATGVAGNISVGDDSITVAKQTDDTYIVTIAQRVTTVLALLHQLVVNSTTITTPAMSQCTVPTIASDKQSLSFRVWGQDVTGTSVEIPSAGFNVELAVTNATFG